MPVYNCENCGVIENTAVGFYWSRDSKIWPEEYRGKKLCSECGPPHFSNGQKSDFGKWHGMFPKRFKKLTDQQQQP